LVGEEAPRRSPAAPLTVAGPDKTGQSDLPNQTIQFAQVQAGASVSCSFHVRTYFGDSTGESTTSSTSSMKGGNFDNNGSDLDKNNILKPTFDTLIEEGHKAFEAYLADLKELFLSRGEVTRQGTVLRDTTPIIFNKPKVIPEVRPDPLPTRNDIQVMINSVLERHAKSTDELLHRLIEEWARKKYNTTSVNPSSSTCAVSLTKINPHTSGASAGGTSMSNPSAHSVNHFHAQTTIEGSTPTFGMPQQTTTSMFVQGYTHTAPSFFTPNLGLAPYTFGYNDRAHPNPNGNYQAMYTTVAYTDLIPLPDSSLGFLHNHAFQILPRFNAYSQLKASGFSYETSLQFPFRSQPVDATPT
jgi:hypothetical protein